MKTVELFSGIGGFRLAADSLGMRTVYANDISKLACRVYGSRFGSSLLFEGDIRELRAEIPEHDLLTAGFPCQPFSSAGKKLGIEDPRGTLFQSIIDVLRDRYPPYFILENVKRLLSMNDGWHFATILSALSRAGYAVEWRLLNAMHFGLAQHRERLILVGTSADLVSAHSIPIRLAPQSDLDSLGATERIQLNKRSLWKNIENHGKRFPTWGVSLGNKFFAASLDEFTDSKPRRRLVDIAEGDVDKAFDFTEDTKERVKDSSHVNKYYNGVQILWNQGGGARMGYTVFGMDGVAPTLTASASRHYERYLVNGRFRRLTNIEYARLQGFPDNHCDGVSIYDQYSLYGNAVPPPLVQWVMKSLLKKPVLTPLDLQQMDMLATNDN